MLDEANFLNVSIKQSYKLLRINMILQNIFKKWPQEVDHLLTLHPHTLPISPRGDEEGLVVLHARYQLPQLIDLQLEAFPHLEDLVLAQAR